MNHQINGASAIIDSLWNSWSTIRIYSRLTLKRLEIDMPKSCCWVNSYFWCGVIKCCTVNENENEKITKTKENETLFAKRNENENGRVQNTKTKK